MNLNMNKLNSKQHKDMKNIMVQLSYLLRLANGLDEALKR